MLENLEFKTDNGCIAFKKQENGEYDKKKIKEYIDGTKEYKEDDPDFKYSNPNEKDNIINNERPLAQEYKDKGQNILIRENHTFDGLKLIKTKSSISIEIEE